MVSDGYVQIEIEGVDFDELERVLDEDTIRDDYFTDAVFQALEGDNIDFSGVAVTTRRK